VGADIKNAKDVAESERGASFEDDYGSDEEPKSESDIEYGPDEDIPVLNSEGSALDLLTGDSTTAPRKYHRGSQPSVRTIHRQKKKAQALAESAVGTARIDAMFASQAAPPSVIASPTHLTVVRKTVARKTAGAMPSLP